MQAEAYSICMDDLDERTEEYSLPGGTVCLAAREQMIVADSVVIRGVWDEEDELCAIDLDLTAKADQLRILRQFKIIPTNVPDHMGTGVKMYFELEGSQVDEELLEDLGDSVDLPDLVDADASFPAVLNLMHYKLKRIEISEPL